VGCSVCAVWMRVVGVGHMSITRTFPQICTAAATISLASTAPAVAEPPIAGNEASEGFIVSVNKCPATAEEAPGGVIDGYTRLEFSTEKAVPIGRDYWGELRSPISRFFAGKSVTRALTLVATYSEHKIDATTSVVSFSHSSGKKGYEWSSEVSNQRLITPYFRIDDRSVVRTSWKLQLNKTYEITAAADLLDIVKRATKLISPSSALLTSLNATRFQDTSQFVDQSMSGFLRESVDESAPDEFPLGPCVGKDLVSLTLLLPRGANVVKFDKAMDTIGTWTVRLAPAIRSVFVPTNASDTPSRVITLVGAGKVFDYPVADNVSLGQFLSGDTAVSAIKDEFKAKGNDQAATAAKLCSQLVGKLQTLGLNRFDTAVAIRAYGDQVLSKGQRTQLLQTSNCSILKEAPSV
jgi:hypothetical protein